MIKKRWVPQPRLEGDIISDPRFHIRRLMEINGWRQEDLAEVMNVTNATVSLLMNGKKLINLDMASKLSAAFGGSAAVWLKMEMKHLGMDKKKEFPDDRGMIYRNYPIRELRLRGWLSLSKNTEQIALSLCDVMGYLEDPDFKLPARRFLAEKVWNIGPSEALSLLWQSVALRYINSIGTPLGWTGNYKKTLQCLDELNCDDEDAAEKILTALKQDKIDFYVLPRLSRMHDIGAVFMVNGKPIIVYAMDGGTVIQLCIFMKVVLWGVEHFGTESFVVHHYPVGGKEGASGTYRNTYQLVSESGETVFLTVLSKREANKEQISCPSVTEKKTSPSNKVGYQKRIYDTTTLEDRDCHQLILPQEWGDAPGPREPVRTTAGAPVTKRIIPDTYYLDEQKDFNSKNGASKHAAKETT